MAIVNNPITDFQSLFTDIPPEIQTDLEQIIYDLGQTVKRHDHTEKTGFFFGVPFIEIVKYSGIKEYHPPKDKVIQIVEYLRKVLKPYQKEQEKLVPIDDWQGKLIEHRYLTVSPNIEIIEFIETVEKRLVMYSLLYVR